MLPSSESGSEGRSTGRKRSAGAMTYLVNEMLSSKTATEAKILGVKLDEENRYGARVVLKLAMDGKTVFWGVNIKKNPNYKILEAQFGREENDWVSQVVLLQLEKDDFTDGYFVRVHFPAKGGRSR